MSNFANPKVVACLTVYFQDDPFEVFNEEVLRAFRNRKFSMAQLGALKKYCELNGWIAGSLPPENGYKSVQRQPKDSQESAGHKPQRPGPFDD
jgi:hypothetical protein